METNIFSFFELFFFLGMFIWKIKSKQQNEFFETVFSLSSSWSGKKSTTDCKSRWTECVCQRSARQSWPCGSELRERIPEGTPRLEIGREWQWAVEWSDLSSSSSWGWYWWWVQRLGRPRQPPPHDRDSSSPSLSLASLQRIAPEPFTQNISCQSGTRLSYWLYKLTCSL